MKWVAVCHEEHVAIESCIIVNHTTFCVYIVSVDVTNSLKLPRFEFVEILRLHV